VADSDEFYVNGRSVLHKGSCGKAIACFPDVCLAPPPPPGGPIPTPFPNNAMASDVTNCAESVFAYGHPVATSESYIEASTGNEAADPKAGGQGGVVTHVVKGKAYFQSYSMDVMVEGKPVVRHLDITTHNHACPTGNAAAQAMTAKQDFLETGRANCGEGCEISTFKPNNCPIDPATGKKKTPHHMVPKHCFKEYWNDTVTGKPIPFRPKGAESSPWESYKPKKAPCICVTGEDKDATGPDGMLLQHGRIHEGFDFEEAVAGLKGGGEWSLAQATAAAAMATKEVLTSCDYDCLVAVIEAAHGEDKKEAKTRAYCPKDEDSNLRQRAQTEVDASANGKDSA
jgi:hypothetical protein